MSKVIISTIGTSLLTQQINRANSDENSWYGKLRDTANLSSENTPSDVLDIIHILKGRAKAKLEHGTTTQIRSASAELNGIYGLYHEKLEQGQQDMHWLIATDTAQGNETAAAVETFLLDKGLKAQVYTPKGLSTANTECFSNGVDDLLTQLESMVQGYQQVYFNLVGGFKSLQAYLNTIGMFYADEIIYIFEGAGSEVIKIPQLPIKIDDSAIAPYVTQFALMAAGAEIQRSELMGIQEALIFTVDDEATLSNWGKLIWNQVKERFLSSELLTFSHLEYQPSFVRDYESTRDRGDRVKLQETLAKASSLLIKHRGNTAALKGDGGIQLETYKNTNIDHFRVTLSLRVSCRCVGNKMSLRYYGTHDHVERSEGVR
ncbi:MAG: CRISPR-associated protein [Desertifilum sp.]|nr:CRISPR-associated protein [Desertifilum sp.]